MADNNSVGPVPVQENQERVSSERKRSCSCHKEILIRDHSILRPGDHITRDVSKKCKCFTFKTAILSHHAIVESVEENNNGTVNLNLIHCNKGGCLRQKEDSVNFQEKDWYKIEYNRPKYKGDEIVTNAGKALKNPDEYNLLRSNCEHFCRLCVMGEKSSIQVNYAARCCISTPSVVTKIIHLFFILFASLPDNIIVNSVSGDAKSNGHTPGWVLILECIVLCFYLYLITVPFLCFLFKFKERTRCKSCLCKQFLIILGRFIFVAIVFSEIIYCFTHNNKLMENNTISDSDHNKYKTIVSATTGISLSYIIIFELFLICSEKCRRKLFRICGISPDQLCSWDCCKCCHDIVTRLCSCCTEDTLSEMIDDWADCCDKCCGLFPLLIQLVFGLLCSIPDLAYVSKGINDNPNGSIPEIPDWIIPAKSVALTLYLQWISLRLIYSCIKYQEIIVCKKSKRRSILQFIARSIFPICNVIVIVIEVLHNNDCKAKDSNPILKHGLLPTLVVILTPLSLLYMIMLEIHLKCYEKREKYHDCFIDCRICNNSNSIEDSHYGGSSAVQTVV